MSPRFHRPRLLVLAALALCLGAALPGAAAAAAPRAELVSRTDIAAPLYADGWSTGPSGVSANGRFVLFPSNAPRLGATGELPALLIHDASDGSTQAVDVAIDGSPSGIKPGPRAGVSDDGRYVLFSSASPGLTGEPTSGVEQVYRRDRQSGNIQLLSRGSDGLPGAARSRAGNMSVDGRHSVFESAAALLPSAGAAAQIYHHDASDGSLALVSAGPGGSAGNGDSAAPQLSADGRYALFASTADNLVAGDTNGQMDLFLRDLQAGTTQRVNLTTTGAQSNDPGASLWGFGLSCSLNLLSQDGRYVAFGSSAHNDPAVPASNDRIYRFDRVTGAVEHVSTPVGSVTPYAENSCPAISADGQRIAYWSTGIEQFKAIYVRDFAAQDLRRLPVEPVSRFSPFRDLSFALPGSGGQLLFASDELLPGHAFAHVYRFDIGTEALQRLSSPAQGSFGPYANHHSARTNPFIGNDRASLSGDARFVAFSSLASNLVTGDSNGIADLFLRDRLTATTQRISLKSGGGESDCASYQPSLTPDGRYVVFGSCGALLAPASGRQAEIYRYDRVLGTLELVSIGHNGGAANGASYLGDISADGTVISFSSCAGNLTATPVSSDHCHAYLRDMATGMTQRISRSAAGLPGNAASQAPRLSVDGRLAVFISAASNLVAGDSNGKDDIFVFDRGAATTTRVDIAGANAQANGNAASVSLSAQADRILFHSSASNLVAGTTPGPVRLYLHDRNLSTTVQIAVPGYADAPVSGADISADGAQVAFVSGQAPSGVDAFDDGGMEKLWRWTRATGSYQALTWFDRPSQAATAAPLFSADGRALVFSSTRADLDAGDGNGAFDDVFLLHPNDAIFMDGFEP